MCPAARTQTHYSAIPRTAKYHLVWRDITTYEGEYQRRKMPKSTITIQSINRPPNTKTFRTSNGERIFRLAKLKRIKRKVIIVAKTKKRTKAVEADELEELEGLEDLDEELEDLDAEDEDDESPEEDEDDEGDSEDEEDEDDEEPAPKSKKSSTTKSKKSEKKTTLAKRSNRVGTTEVAEHFGVDGRTLRMVLRKHNIEKDPETKRYEWSSLKHPEVVRIGKLLAKGEAKRAQKEKLDNLKAKKKSSTTKKRKKVEDDEE